MFMVLNDSLNIYHEKIGSFVSDATTPFTVPKNEGHETQFHFFHPPSDNGYIF